jgi:hypothetical protein
MTFEEEEMLLNDHSHFVQLFLVEMQLGQNYGQIFMIQQITCVDNFIMKIFALSDRYHMDPTNTTIVWARNSFIGSVVSCRVDFEQNLA